VPTSTNKLPRALRRALALSVLLAIAGCGPQELVTDYGIRTGPLATQSVNGTSVLGDMVAAAGHRVDSRRFISPNLATAQTIVWFPDDFNAPKAEVTQWLDNWVREEDGRTLVYVGRDFDAAPLYWESVQLQYRGTNSTVAARNLSQARSMASSARSSVKRAECSWFELKMNAPARRVTKLAGPWSTGIDPSKARIHVHGRMIPAAESEVLLKSAGDALVSRQEIEEMPTSQILLVSNGSFLLNMPLVNHEHRKLAGRLIDAMPEGRVVFLESNVNGPRITDREPPPTTHTGLEILGIWPMGAILLHFAVLGIIFCFARWPIFGLPSEAESEAPTDFGRHIEALGKLLEQSGNETYARGSIEAAARKVKLHSETAARAVSPNRP